MRTVSYDGWEWLGAPLAIDLANSLPAVRPGRRLDLLAEPEDLASWLHAQRERLPSFEPDARDLEAFRELRDALHACFWAVTHGQSPDRPALELVNRAARQSEAPTALRLGRSGVRADVSGPAVSTRALCLVARSAIALWADGWIDHLKVCEAPGCSMFFLARGRQEWCSVPCGNRARAARHARRTRPSAAPRR